MSKKKSMNILIKIINIIYLSYIIFLRKKNIKNLNKKIDNLGPVFIKFAQILSLRSDLLEPKIIKDLEKLQTHSNSIHYNKIIHILKKEKIFSQIKRINENPIASASVAQIHTAVLKNNKKIVIKIIKPNINKIINNDIKLLYFLSAIIMMFFKKKRRLKLLDLTDEIKNTFKKELNLKNEYTNIIIIKKNMLNLSNLHIPNVSKNFSDSILIAEYIDGINILNKKKIKKLNLNTETIAKNVIDIFYKQVFEYNIFHADLHPGNILISLEKRMNPIIILMDFGITSSLKNDEKLYLAENILAFIKKDYKKIIYLHKKAQTILTKEEDVKIEHALKNIFDKITNNSLKSINFKLLITSIMTMGEKFNMQMQPNLVLFQKTLITIEGLCRNLNKNLNLWKLSRQSIEKILLTQLIKIHYTKMTIIKNNKIQKKTSIIISNTNNLINFFLKKDFFYIKIYITISIILNFLFISYKIIITIN